MDNALMIGMQTQMVLQRRMEAVANNIANVSTTGFKADNIAFEADSGDARDYGKVPDIRFVREAGLVRDMSTGPIASTGNPLDVAIDGDGFFSVQGQNGETLYTRAGSFTLSADGQLQTTAGQPVLSEIRRAAGVRHTRWSADHRQDGNRSRSTALKPARSACSNSNRPKASKRWAITPTPPPTRRPRPLPTRALSRAPLRAPTCARWWSLPE